MEPATISLQGAVTVDLRRLLREARRRMTPGPRDHSSDREHEIARYLATGHDDDDGWRRYEGPTSLEQMRVHGSALRSALLQRVAELEAAGEVPTPPAQCLDRSWLREKLRPMVEGLFVADDQPRVLEFVQGSVVFLTQGTVHRLLPELRWDHTAWCLARIWLDSIDAPPLADEAPGLLGLSEEKTCYVSLRYFQDLERDPFADYVVHEVAHLFHNNKRSYVGLPPCGRREWMLDIEFRKRELFAYACEVYSRIVARASNRREREALVAEFAPHAEGFADQLDPDELVDILRQAARAQSGWRAILRRCAPAPKRRALRAIAT